MPQNSIKLITFGLANNNGSLHVLEFCIKKNHGNSVKLGTKPSRAIGRRRPKGKWRPMASRRWKKKGRRRKFARHLRNRRDPMKRNSHPSRSFPFSSRREKKKQQNHQSTFAFLSISFNRFECQLLLRSVP